ncbi:MAG: MBL fold metallo-hydrolase [Dehalococcoidia bacterium]|tara:strand:- start:636 stop:1250 length:615 start_codon:yes stop_codon:yes gene_type:complete
MDINWFGKSALRIKSKKGAIICDPCPKTKTEDMKRPVADAITISSYDEEKYFIKGVKGDPLLINAPGEFEISGIQIQGYTSLNVKNQTNLFYCFEIEGIRTLYIGNLVNTDDLYNIDSITNIDILVLAIESNTGNNIAELDRLVRAIDAKIIIPIDYVAKGAKKTNLEDFKKSLSLEIEEVDDKFSIKKNEIEEKSKIILLNKK